MNTLGQSIGNFSTVRDITLNSGVGLVVVPSGTYRKFTANRDKAVLMGPEATERSRVRLQASARSPSEESFRSFPFDFARVPSGTKHPSHRTKRHQKGLTTLVPAATSISDPLCRDERQEGKVPSQNQLVTLNGNFCMSS